jgi:LysR family transcriptional regulator, hypochlorite-specific transcription factor HypT
METKWLEDFVSLAETKNFSRSAALRHVTQPAFSRRIQSLEAWVGADLVDRTSYPTQLTHAGEIFYEQAIKMLGQINDARALLRGKRVATATTIDFAVPHTLSLTFVPHWLASLEAEFGAIHSRLLALNVHDAVMTLTEGGCDLILCYHHPRQPLLLDPSQYEMISMGREALRAYTRCDKSGKPDFTLPGTADAPLPFLAYTNSAYLGRMVEVILNESSTPLQLAPCYETDMAEGLKMMALEGRGIAFLPESAVVRELKQGSLMRADGDSGQWELDMEIRLYRARPSLEKPGKPIVAKLWEYVQLVQNRVGL